MKNRNVVNLTSSNPYHVEPFNEVMKNKSPSLLSDMKWLLMNKKKKKQLGRAKFLTGTLSLYEI